MGFKIKIKAPKIPSVSQVVNTALNPVAQIQQVSNVVQTNSPVVNAAINPVAALNPVTPGGLKLDDIKSQASATTKDISNAWRNTNREIDRVADRSGKGIVRAVTTDPYLMVREALGGNWNKAGKSAGRFYATGAAVVGAAYGAGALFGGSSKAAPPPTETNGDIFQGNGPTSSPGVLSPAPTSSSGSLGSVAAGATTGAAASTPWWSTGIKIAETLGITKLLTSRLGGSSSSPGSTFGGSNDTSLIPYPVFGPGGSLTGGASGGGFSLPELDDKTKKTLIVGGLVIATILFARAVKRG